MVDGNYGIGGAALRGEIVALRSTTIKDVFGETALQRDVPAGAGRRLDIVAPSE
jgi:hypothetical protein